MTTSPPGDAPLLRSLVDNLRERLRQLQLENEELAHENLALRSRLIQMKRDVALKSGPTARRLLDESTDELSLHRDELLSSPPLTSPRAPMAGRDVTRPHQVALHELQAYAREQTLTPPQGQDSMRHTWTGAWSAPPELRQHQPEARPDPAYQAQAPAARPRGLESDYYGRPLTPGEFDPRAATPATSLGPAPALDLGYINNVSAQELDTLPYGLVVLDTQGNVLFYNETESRLAGFAREQVLGKNFFREVAPCTRVQAFEGRFLEFVEGKLGRVTFFDFAFHFARGTQNVLIAVSHGRRKGHINVMMIRK